MNQVKIRVESPGRYVAKGEFPSQDMNSLPDIFPMLQKLIKGNNQLRYVYTKALENDGKIISTERLDILKVVEPFILEVASILFRELVNGWDADVDRELLVLGGEKTHCEIICVFKERKWTLRGNFSREELEVPSMKEYLLQSITPGVERIFALIREAAHDRQVTLEERVVIRPALVDLIHRLVFLHYILEVPRTTF